MKHEQLSHGAKKLEQLIAGDTVYIQAQHGNKPKLWNKSGVVLENLGFDAYLVKVDGSNNVTQRNRQFLRKFSPFTSTPREYQPAPYCPPVTR